MSGETRRNNFDLLRLFAALQVAYFHARYHLDPGTAAPLRGAVEAVLAQFPGVPVFFVISGFLISLAYERAASLGTYSRNRFLRLYPALWACFAACLVLLAAFGQLDRAVLASGGFWLWVLGQLTIAPMSLDAFRDFGIGSVNGSLWTIPVELAFYAAIPLLYAIVIDGPLRAVRRSLLAAAAIVSFALYIWTFTVPETTLVKLVSLTLPAHLHMFLLGLFLQRGFDACRPWLEGRGHLWLAAYVVLGVCADRLIGRPESPALGFAASAAATGVLRVMLAVTVVSVAFTRHGAAHRLLRGNDASYGVYLYHAPVINACAALGFRGAPALATVVGAALALGALSWILVEKPALRRKRSTIHRVEG